MAAGHRTARLVAAEAIRLVVEEAVATRVEAEEAVEDTPRAVDTTKS